MVCYQCGVRLSEHDFCTGCGADVVLYKKILSTSNRLYNEGLEKAGVRDLAGAVEVLRQSLKYYKNNVKARNLLGLCYFELGEVIAALSEWVISKNIRPNRNIADDYIKMVQENQTRLESINLTLKKFNQALAYCHQDSQDLAIIQLKKVLSYNPKYVKAHQLLALIYIFDEEWQLAKTELLKCSEIDANNTITLRYLQVVNQMMLPEDIAKGNITNNKSKDNPDVVRYQSGNETIIQPGRRRDFRLISTIFNFAIGIAIGIAITISLILPSRLNQAQSEAANQVRVISEEMDQKTATIAELELAISRLGEENERLSAELTEYRDSPVLAEAGDHLLLAAAAVILGPDAEDEGAYIENIVSLLDIISPEEIENGSPAFMELYDNILASVGAEMSALCYEIGYDYYSAEDYASAIPHLMKAFQYNNANDDALWYLANAYDRNGEMDKARETYAQVIEFFPGTDKALRSEERMVEINVTGA